MTQHTQPPQNTRDIAHAGTYRDGERTPRRASDTPKTRGTLARRAGYAVAMLVNTILLSIVHSLPQWRLPILTPAFSDTLWAFDLSLGATIVANALFFAYDEPWFRDLMQIALSGLALVVAATLYRVFPFDFGDATSNNRARLVVVVVIFAICIAIIAQVVAWLVGVIRPALRGDAPGTPPR
jgi:hypothetical protein